MLRQKKFSLARKIIVFSIFLLTMGILAPLIIFYSMGYRFDLNKDIFVHSGTIVIKTNPAEVNIRLNNQDISKASLDLINQSLNINGLMPKKYDLEVTSPNHQTWKKQVDVHSGIATEYWSVVLPPNQVDESVLLQKNVLNYSFSPDKKKLAYFVQSADSISLFIREGGNDYFIFKEDTNQRFSPAEGELKWSPDNGKLIFSFKKDNQEKILSVVADGVYDKIIPLGEIWAENLILNSEEQNKADIGQSKNKPSNSDYSNANDLLLTTNYSWQDKDKIYFLINNNLYVQSFDTLLSWWKTKEQISSTTSDNQNNQNGNLKLKNSNQNSQKSSLQNFLLPDNAKPKEIKSAVLGFTFCDDLICLVDQGSKAFKIINDEGTESDSASIPSEYPLSEKYQLFAYGKEYVTILDKEGNFFLWDKVQNKKNGSNDLKFLAPKVKGAYFSDDGKKLLFNTDKEVCVYFVKEWEVQPKHLLGDIETVYRQDTEIEKVQWYADYQNVFIINNENIKFVELDNRGGQNIFTFLQEKNLLNVNYDAPNKKLWFTKNSGGETQLIEVVFPVSKSLFSGLVSGG